MSLHNRVDATVYCPACGTKLDNLETRDDTVEQLRYEVVPIETVRTFYGQCDRCNAWLEFERRPNLPGARPADFTLIWDPDRERLLSRRRFFTRFFD